MEVIKLENNNGELSATSLEIARVTGKQHKRVLEDIRDELGEPNFGLGSYLDKQNQERPMYILDEYQTLQLMSKYSREVRTMVINEYKRMKEYIKSQQTTKPQTTEEFLLAATKHIEQLQARNNQLTTNLKAYEKYGKSVLVREFVKIVYTEDKIEIGEREMWNLLHEQKYIDKNKLPYAKYKKYFEVRSVVKNGAVRKTTKISPKGILYFTNKLIKMTEDVL